MAVSFFMSALVVCFTAAASETAFGGDAAVRTWCFLRHGPVLVLVWGTEILSCAVQWGMGKKRNKMVSSTQRRAPSSRRGFTLQFSSAQCSRSVVPDSLRPHETQHTRPSLSITNSRSSLRLASIEWVMPSSHLILGCPLLLPPIPPSIKVFSNESTLRMRWPKYWSLDFFRTMKWVACKSGV